MPDQLSWDKDATKYPFTISMESEKAKVYLQKLWVVSAVFAAVANDGFADMSLTIGQELQASGLFATGGDAYYFAHKAAQVSAGSAPVITNAHMGSTRQVPWTSILKGPTVSNAGTKLVEGFAPGGGGPTSIGVIAGKVVEYHLTPDTYLFRIQNKAGVAKDISITLYIVEL